MVKTELTRRPQFQRLAGNPFFLTCLGMISWKDHLQVFPEQRPEVYRIWLEELALSVGEQGDPSHTWHDQEFQQNAFAALTEIGWQFQQQCYNTETAWICNAETIIPHLAPQRELAEEMLAFWQQAGLLESIQIQNHTSLTFRHVIVQEYAAAQKIARVWNADPDAGWTRLKPLLYHPAWLESTLMLVGMLERSAADTLLGRILHGRSDYERVLHRRYRLAAVMLGERDDMQDSALARRIIRQLTRLRTPPAPPVPSSFH